MKEYKSLVFDYNNMMKDFVGEKEGFSEKELKNNFDIAVNAHKTFEENRGLNMLGWTELPYNQKGIVKHIKTVAKRIRKADAFVVLGIGGSALGTNALFNPLCHLHHNELKKSKRKAPKLYVEDNIDPVRMKELLDVLDLDKTIFNVISKSGSTSETMSQFLIIYKMLKDLYGENAKDHIIATTDEKNGNLIKIAKEEDLETFFIPDGVGGRFSVISPVGLLPAAILGIDINELLKGCIHMDKMCRKPNLKNPALIFGLLQYLSMQKGKNISVIMPYSDNLKLIADWYCQLWAESLGKKLDLKNNIVHTGQTPVGALGVTDQHSQIQLYTEGPFDKVITLIGVKNFKETVEIPHMFSEYPSVNFLSGNTLNDLITNERIATEYALTKNQRLNNSIVLEEINAHTIGQLLMFFMIQTAYVGAMLNIDTFNQPGVEEGKNATYALFGRKGYESKLEELKSAKQKSDKYII